MKLKLLMVCAALIIGGCGYNNEYHTSVPANTPVERQMEIQRHLEAHGWTNIGFHPSYDRIVITATRRPGTYFYNVDANDLPLERSIEE